MVWRKTTSFLSIVSMNVDRSLSTGRRMPINVIGLNRPGRQSVWRPSGNLAAVANSARSLRVWADIHPQPAINYGCDERLNFREDDAAVLVARVLQREIIKWRAREDPSSRGNAGPPTSCAN